VGRPYCLLKHGLHAPLPWRWAVYLRDDRGLPPRSSSATEWPWSMCPRAICATA
jgi:hypothetical protein